MSRLGEKTIEFIADRIEALTRYHLSGINDSYKKFGDDDPDFKMTFKTTIKPSDKGNRVIVELAFPPGPNNKDSSSGTVNEDQQDLFPKEGRKPKIIWEFPYRRPCGPIGPSELGYPVWRKKRTVWE